MRGGGAALLLVLALLPAAPRLAVAQEGAAAPEGTGPAGPAAADEADEADAADEPAAPKRPLVIRVRIAGNKAFDDSRLEKLLVTRPSRLWARVRYFPEVLEQDLETLRLFYEQEGYLQARILGTQVQEDPQRNTVVVIIELEEGPLTRVEALTVSGNLVYDDAQILARLHLEPGDPFRSPVVREDILDLMRLYGEGGYLEADVRPEIRLRPEQNLAAIHLSIEERSRFRVGRILIKGQEKTRARVIEREVALQPGDIVRYSRLVETQRRLFRTGLFRSVYVSPVDPASDEPDRKDIVVEVQENESIEINASLGYSSIGKLGASAEVTNNNIAGTALRAGVQAGADFWKQGAGLSFTEPRLFGTRTQMELTTRLERLLEPGYDLLRILGGLHFGWLLGERSRASIGYQYERDAISHVEVSPLPADLDSDLHSLIGTYYLDARDDLLNTTRGYFTSWEARLGQDLPVGGFTPGTRFNPYLQLSGTARFWWPATPTTVLASSLSGGWLTHLAGRDPFALSQLFYTGGPDTVRGYAYQSVGPLDTNGTPLGGTLLLNWNVVELRQVLFQPLSAAFFLDAGGLWAHPSEFSLSDIRLGIGAGLRLNTPIGVVRLDGALKVDPREGEPIGAVHLGIGQIF